MLKRIREYGPWPVVDSKTEVAIRPLENLDVAYMTPWFCDVELIRYAFGFQQDIDFDVLRRVGREYCAGLWTSKANSFAILRSGVQIGLLRYDVFYTEQGEIAVVGILLGNSFSRGKGLGTVALRLFVHFLFEAVGVDMIEMDTAYYNKGATQCFLHAGFEDVADGLYSYSRALPDPFEHLAAPKRFFRYTRQRYDEQNLLAGPADE